MDTNPIALIVGTGAAVLIARTFYESFSSARRGHPNAVPKRESQSKRSNKPSAASSRESTVNEVSDDSIRSASSSPASGSGSLKEFSDTLSSVDQRLSKSAEEANVESNVSTPASPAPSIALSQRMSDSLAIDPGLVDVQEDPRPSVDVGSSNEAAVYQSSDGLALVPTSGAAHNPEDYIQLHTCSHLPGEATEQSQSGVHVSVDIKNKPESGVHVSVDVMPKADLVRLASNVEKNSQTLMKQLEGSTHLSERFEYVSEAGILRLENSTNVKDQIECVHKNAVSTPENCVRERPENGYENYGQRSGRGSSGSGNSAHSERSNESAVKSPAERVARDSEHSAQYVDRHSEDGMKLPENAQHLSEISAHSAVGHENISENSGHEEDVVKHPEIARVSEQSAKFEHEYVTVNQPESNDHESGHAIVDSAQPENEDQNSLKITSSGIDQEIRRSIAEESLKNARFEDSGLAVDESLLRPGTPAFPLDLETVRTTVQALCAIFNEQQKYNKDATNYLMQIKMARCDNVAEGNERPTDNISSVPFQDVFYSSLRRDGDEDDNTDKIIDTMNEYLVGEYQEEDVESVSAGSDSNAGSNIDSNAGSIMDSNAGSIMDSNVGSIMDSNAESNGSEHAVEEEPGEVQEVSTLDESNSEEQSNTTTSSMRDSLVIYVKDRDEKDDSRTEGFEDIDVVSCTPNIFQNVIVRRILKE